MKKIIISGFILSSLFLLATIGQAKSKVVKTYAFGFAASFNDSIVHFTDIQELDSSWLNDKGFLMSRENYSYQLRDFLASQGMEHRTCIICYSPKLNKTKKKFTKMMDNYSKSGSYDIRLIKASDFKFDCIEPNNINDDVVAPQKVKKKEKKEKKEKRKKGKIIKE
ncbi:MAG: hypothetical protein IJK46_07180 [Prevotella sp.]|nr:hypothetical protein [Prevotella sp.]